MEISEESTDLEEIEVQFKDKLTDFSDSKNIFGAQEEPKESSKDEQIGKFIENELSLKRSDLPLLQ